MSQSDQPQSQNLVTVATFSTAGEANLAITALEQEEISAFLECENMVDAMWYISNAVGGVKLQVAEADIEQAHKLLDEIKLNRVEREATETEEEDIETVVFRAYKVAVWGTVILPVVSHIYSLRLLSQISRNDIAQASASVKRRYYFAYLVNILVFLLLLYLLYVASQPY